MLEIVEKKHRNFNKMWNSYLQTNPTVSWRYLNDWIVYQKEYSKSFQKDLSFLIKEGQNVLAICPLLIENNNSHFQASSGDDYMPSPDVSMKYDKKFRKKIENFCFYQIDHYAKTKKIKKIKMMTDPCSQNWDFNHLTQYGFLDSSIATEIIDLRNSVSEIKSSFRSSYKSIINQSSKIYQIKIIDCKNPEYQIHEEYRKLHHKSAGRITRNIKTFDLQFELLKKDNAMLIGLMFEKKFIAFSYFFHHNRNIYYASSSDNPNFKVKVPIEHLIIWSAIEYYVNRKFSKMEIGWQQFGPQLFDFPSNKDINISFFKRGFGGSTVSLFRGVKYYETGLMKREINEQSEKIIQLYEKTKRKK